jgi:SPFH domain / Band 7 family
MSESVQHYRPPEATPVGHAGTRVEIHERPAWAISGWAGVLILAVCIAACFPLAGSSVPALIAVPIAVAVIVLSSLVIVQPGHTKVVRFFGTYVGTIRRTGLWWIVPLADRRSLSIRVRNFETNRLKVNDADGNPVEIAAIVVWQVADTSKAVYAVDEYVDFVQVQAESALRHVATTRPYECVKRSGVDDRRGWLVSAQHHHQVAHHRCLAFLVELHDPALIKPGECHVDHAHRAVDDPRARRDDRVGLLAAEHCLGDLRRVREMTDAHLDDLHPGDRDPLGHLTGELSGDHVG